MCSSKAFSETEGCVSSADAALEANGASLVRAPGMSCEVVVGFGSLVLGGLLLGRMNEEPGALIVAAFFLLVGVVLNFLVGQGDRYAQRAFVLVYCACVLVAGLAQWYAHASKGVLITGLDAHYFYGRLLENPPYAPWPGPLRMNAPFPLYVWQRLYHVSNGLGFSHGPWLGVLFNALLVGLSSSFAVRIGRELFGRDDARLRRIGTLCSLCGMFWLFGGLFFRDAFALFLNTVVVWVYVRFLRRSSWSNCVLIVPVLAVSYWTMLHVRDVVADMLLVYGGVCLALWSWKVRSGVARFFLVCAVPAALFLLFVYGRAHYADVGRVATREAGGYVVHAEKHAGADSLGMAFIVNRSMLIRLPLGSAVILIYPIPLYRFLSLRSEGYYLLMSWHGVFMVFIMPWVLAGMWISVRQAMRGCKERAAHVFLVLYAVLSLLAVAASSLETRHYGQFLPILFVLAAVPMGGEKGARKVLLELGLAWYCLVVFVHVAWTLLKLA